MALRRALGPVPNWTGYFISSAVVPDAWLRVAFTESGDMRELVTAIVLSSSFRHVNLAETEEGE